MSCRVEAGLDGRTHDPEEASMTTSGTLRMLRDEPSLDYWEGE